MREETKGTLYICDACQSRTFVTEFDEPPTGLHGNVLHVYGGGNSFEFFSCKENPNHMATALQNAWKRYQEKGRFE